jgi:hypothetical protein
MIFLVIISNYSPSFTPFSYGNYDYSNDIIKIDVINGYFLPENILNLSKNIPSEISFGIVPSISVHNITIEIILPYDLVEIVKGELTWSGNAKKDESISMNFTIKSIENIECSIRARVKGFTQKGLVEQSYYLVVSSVDRQSFSTSQFNPSRQFVSQNNGKLIEHFQSPDPGNIDVLGQFYYVDEYGYFSPIRYGEGMLNLVAILN